MTAPTSPNPYITGKLNNMVETKLFKKERDNWTKLYHKTLKGLEAMIDIQRQVWDIMRMVEKMNTTITEIEEMILKTSINNWTTNATNILEILEDLWYLIQSNMEDWVYQVQWMLADKLDGYKGRGNAYMDNNIQEIQDLYREKEQKKELGKGRVEDEKVIPIKPWGINNHIQDNIIQDN